jgi:hypothetical protein
MRLKKKKRVSSSSALTSQSSTVDEDSRDSRDAERPMSWEGELSDSEMSRLDEAIVAGRGAIVAAAQANSLQVSKPSPLSFNCFCCRARKTQKNGSASCAPSPLPPFGRRCRVRQSPALSRLGHCASACDTRWLLAPSKCARTERCVLKSKSERSALPEFPSC